MCGIFSSLCDENLEVLNKYFQLIKYRGPDSSKLEQIDVLNDKPLIFGFHRLAIVDPTEKSMQPLYHDDLYLICNGEIFNHKELEEIYGLRMKTGSDCEIIIHLYNHFGRNELALKRVLLELEAEFAFVLYDKRNKTLMAARDPFGVRPLFYSHDNSEICFASELKALLFRNSADPFKPGNYIYLNRSNMDNAQFINYYSIKKRISNNEIVNYAENVCSMDIIYFNIRRLITEAVKQRLMSDRPVGAMLSGGLDSSLITSLVSQHIPGLECFSIGLRDDSFDIMASKKVVKYLNNKGANIKHHIINFTIEEGFKSLRDVIWHLETRCVTSIRAGVINYLLAKYIKENTDITVLYSGSGSDEIFNGYQYGKMIMDPDVVETDSIRLLNELYLYDNLRDDRCASAFSLEVRVPFLYRNLVDYIFSISAEHRLSRKKIEKALLRDAFKGADVLPDEILYRRKEAFSNGIDSVDESWYQTLTKKYLEPLVSDEEFEKARNKFPFDTPKTKEAYYYRKIFEELFPRKEKIIPKIWLPPADIMGKEIIDPSATVLECYKQ